MKFGFEQTSDLVRFRIDARAGVFHILHELYVTLGSRWIWQDAGDCTVVSFVCPKDDAPRVLDILEKHGVERVKELRDDR